MKSYIVTPLLLLIYVAVIAYMTFPGRTPESELSYTQYYITVAVSVVIVIVLGFFLKKKHDNNQKYKNKD